MKKQIVITMFFIFILTISYGQDWLWARHLGSNYPPYGERPNSIISDGTNYYVIGSYGGTFYLPSDTLHCNGNDDIFILKFDANGNQIWAKTLGGNYNQPDAHEGGNGVFDPINNCIYIAGEFINSINFGNGISLNSPYPNHADIFLAKMDLNGNFIWAKKGGSSGEDNANVFTQPNGDALIAGRIVNDGNIDTAYISSGGFFARFDSDGNLKWAEHKFSGFAHPRISFIGSDILMAGAFSSNPSIIDTLTITPIGQYDGFITRMDSMGKVKWIKIFGSLGQDGFSGINTNNLNDIYAVGFFNDTIIIDGQTLSNIGNDNLITKFDQYGNLIWARQTHANGNYYGVNDVVSDTTGNVYITGLFAGIATFGNYNISTSNLYDMFLACYDSNGNCKGVIHFGQASGACLVKDNFENIFCTGSFINTISIGDSIFTSYGQQDIFIAKANAITGIMEYKTAIRNQLLIYANPTTGKCTVSVPDDFLHEKHLTLSIFDAGGKMIQQKTLEMNEGRIKVDLEEEAKGIYNVTLGNGKRVYGGRIVFQ